MCYLRDDIFFNNLEFLLYENGLFSLDKKINILFLMQETSPHETTSFALAVFFLHYCFSLFVLDSCFNFLRFSFVNDIYCFLYSILFLFISILRYIYDVYALFMFIISDVHNIYDISHLNCIVKELHFLVKFYYIQKI